MFSQQRVRSALLSTFAVLLLLVISAGAPVTGVSQATNASPAGAAGPAATLPCNLITPFNATNFPSSPTINNPWFPLVPGTQFTWQGRANTNGTPLEHQIVLIVTDLTKIVHGVRTVVLWDRDFNTGALTESELTFHAQDNAGNIWNLGEYPAQYKGGKFTDAADTWISGLAGAQGGTVVLGNPQVGTPMFLQAYAPPDIILDCGQVSQMGVQHVCVPVGCYDNVLIVNETSPPETAIQRKFYAQGVGNLNVDAVNDPEGETLVLSETLHLGRDACIAARQAVLALEDQAYHHDTSQTVYDLTAPMQQTGLCENIQLTPTPSVSPTASATPTATITPIATPPAAPGTSIFLPITANIIATPTLPPAIYDGCKSDPNPGSAANFPVRIVKVDKIAEVVTLQNVSDKTISLEDWNLCSINGNQDHDQIGGTIGPGKTRSFPNDGTPNIWNDTQRDDAALYNAAGFLVSYWVDQWGQVGQVFNPENLPGVVYETDEILSLTEKAATPAGPTDQAILVKETLMDNSIEHKVYAADFGIVEERADDEQINLVLSIRTDAKPGAVPEPLHTLEAQAEDIIDVVPSGDWRKVAADVAVTDTAWQGYQAQAKNDQIPQPFQDALTAALDRLGTRK